MKRYERSLKTQLFVSILWILLSVVQIYTNTIENRPVFLVCMFGFTLAVFLVLAVLIGLDLVLKDDRAIAGRIVHINGSIIGVLKPNGKVRRARIPTTEELAGYRLEQKVELILARRTGILTNINSELSIGEGSEGE